MFRVEVTERKEVKIFPVVLLLNCFVHVLMREKFED